MLTIRDMRKGKFSYITGFSNLWRSRRAYMK